MGGCFECGGYIYSDGVCGECGLVNEIIYENSYKDKIECYIEKKIVYSRNVYFDDLLSYLTVEDNKQFDHSCVNKLLNSPGLENLRNITYTQLLNSIKSYNKSHKRKINCNHIYRIYFIITGKKLINISTEEKKRIDYMFYYFEIEFCNRIEYIRNEFDIKSSVINYHFLISKIFEMVGLEHYNKYLKKVKCNKNIKKYNQIWDYIYQFLEF